MATNDTSVLPLSTPIVSYASSSSSSSSLSSTTASSVPVSSTTSSSTTSAAVSSENSSSNPISQDNINNMVSNIVINNASSSSGAMATPTVPIMKPSGSKFTSVTTISFAEDMNPRYRSTMEDACAVIDTFGGDAGTGYFGIYDGHGGRNVAEFIRLHLHVNVEKELRVKGDRSIEECLKAAFLITDMECSMTGEQASGSTAAVVIVRKQGAKRYAYTANCGDARAVLCHAGVAVRLSKDHKATDNVEKARIEAAGGFVARKRVMGVLAVARAFGDFVLKKFVTAEPFTSTTKLDAMSQFIIIACDGVWDVLEDQEAVDMIREHLGSGAGMTSPPHSKAKTAAQILVDAALAKGSSDNITVLIVFL